eukprot:6486215-Amphidinium_carterae.1
MFYCDMLKELDEFWTKHQIPKDQQCLNPEASAQRQRYYYVHDAPTSHCTETETSTTMNKRLEVDGAALPAGTEEHAAIATEPANVQLTAAQAAKLAKSKEKTVQKMVQAMLPRLQACRKMFLTRQIEISKDQLLRLDAAELWCREYTGTMPALSDAVVEKLTSEHQCHMQFLDLLAPPPAAAASPVVEAGTDPTLKAPPAPDCDGTVDKPVSERPAKAPRLE